MFGLNLSRFGAVVVLAILGTQDFARVHTAQPPPQRRQAGRPCPAVPPLSPRPTSRQALAQVPRIATCRGHRVRFATARPLGRWLERVSRLGAVPARIATSLYR